MNLLFREDGDKLERQKATITNLQRVQQRKSLELCGGKRYEVDSDEEHENDDNDTTIGVSHSMSGGRDDWGGKGNKNGKDRYYREQNNRGR